MSIYIKMLFIWNSTKHPWPSVTSHKVSIKWRPKQVLVNTHYWILAILVGSSGYWPLEWYLLGLNIASLLMIHVHIYDPYHLSADQYCKGLNRVQIKLLMLGYGAQSGQSLASFISPFHLDSESDGTFDWMTPTWEPVATVSIQRRKRWLQEIGKIYSNKYSPTVEGYWGSNSILPVVFISVGGLPWCS